MRYQYKNILLEIEAPKGSVTKDGKLVFKGHSYLAIKEFNIGMFYLKKDSISLKISFIETLLGLIALTAKSIES